MLCGRVIRLHWPGSGAFSSTCFGDKWDVHDAISANPLTSLWCCLDLTSIVRFDWISISGRIYTGQFSTNLIYLFNRAEQKRWNYIVIELKADRMMTLVVICRMCITGCSQIDLNLADVILCSIYPATALVTSVIRSANNWESNVRTSEVLIPCALITRDMQY